MIRHAINPTSPFRMQLILETVLKERQATMSSTPKFDADNLVDQLLDMKISDTDQTKVKVSCNCTRKCKTIKSASVLKKLCHVIRIVILQTILAQITRTKCLCSIYLFYYSEMNLKQSLSNNCFMISKVFRFFIVSSLHFLT